MIRPAFVCGLMAAATVVTASAEDFPLNFQTIPAKDVMSFIGGAGVYGLLQPAKPFTGSVATPPPGPPWFSGSTKPGARARATTNSLWT
jgi:hypothetical protein